VVAAASVAGRADHVGRRGDDTGGADHAGEALELAPVVKTATVASDRGRRPWRA